MAILELDGLRVEYDRSGSGPDLLCLHSLLTELTVFDRVLPSLAATRRVTRFNLPGFGESTPTAFDSVADHADHVARVMQALELPASTAVFGNGFGAFVAAELAIRHGRRFGPLVLADAVAAFPEAARVPFRVMAEKVRAGGMPAVLDAAIGRMFPPEFAARNADVVGARKHALAVGRARLLRARLPRARRARPDAAPRRHRESHARALRRARSDHAARARAGAGGADPGRDLSGDPRVRTLSDARAAGDAGAVPR